MAGRLNQVQSNNQITNLLNIFIIFLLYKNNGYNYLKLSHYSSGLTMNIDSKMLQQIFFFFVENTIRARFILVSFYCII